MMQRIFVFILLIAAVLCAAEKKPRVAVLAFTAKGVSQMESEAVTELFASSLVSSRAFDVLDRANMDNILREQQFQQTGCTETACAVKIGKVLNVEYMIYGVVMNIGDKYFVSANMVNIETSKIEKSAQESTDNFKQINEALRRLIEKLTGVTMEDGDKGTKIKYFGRITSVNGNEVTINAGSDDGVRLNEEYVVLSGKKVKRRNDQTGMMENVNERTEIGRLKITTVGSTESKGIVTSGTLSSGNLVNLNTMPYNDTHPLLVASVSILSPAIGSFMVKDNLIGQIIGVAGDAIRVVLIIDWLTARSDSSREYTYIKGGITPLPYGSAHDFIVNASLVFVPTAVICAIVSGIAAGFNCAKYDDLSKFAYANEPSVSFAVAPTPEFDGMNVRFALRW